MNLTFTKKTLLALSVATLSLSTLAFAEKYQINSGKIEFDVGSNIPFLKVKGKSKKVTGTGEATVEGKTAIIKNLNITVPVKSVKTGMKLRDKHLHEKVFTANDGSLPAINLQSKKFIAKLNHSTGKFEGKLVGKLFIRGESNNVQFDISISDYNKTNVLVQASGAIKPSKFGVKPITYNKAKVNDSVTIKVSKLKFRKSQ